MEIDVVRHGPLQQYTLHISLKHFHASDRDDKWKPFWLLAKNLQMVCTTQDSADILVLTMAMAGCRAWACAFPFYS